MLASLAGSREALRSFGFAFVAPLRESGGSRLSPPTHFRLLARAAFTGLEHRGGGAVLAPCFSRLPKRAEQWPKRFSTPALPTSHFRLSHDGGDKFRPRAFPGSRSERSRKRSDAASPLPAFPLPARWIRPDTSAARASPLRFSRLPAQEARAELERRDGEDAFRLHAFPDSRSAMRPPDSPLPVFHGATSS